MSSAGFKLTIARELRLDELPSDEQVIAASREVLEATKGWKKGKAYGKKTVQTYSSPKGPGDGAHWHCRVSEHAPAQITFDELWSKLGSSNHSEYEKEYIKDVKKATLVKKISPTQEIWTMYYEFSSFGVSPRVFTVLQVTHYDSSARTGLFISIPVDLTSDPELAKLEEEGVKGRYVSVETIKELPSGNTEWRMATSSSPGGRIPTFLVESSMASSISADVPHFLRWFQSTKQGTSLVESPAA